MSSCAHIPGLCCPLWPPLYYCFSVSCRVMMLGSHWWEVATSAIRSHAAFPSKVISYPCLWGFCIMNHIRLLTGILWDAYKLLMLFCIVDCPLICTNYRELGCTYMGITTLDKGLARHLQLFFPQQDSTCSGNLPLTPAQGTWWGLVLAMQNATCTVGNSTYHLKGSEAAWAI